MAATQLLLDLCSINCSCLAKAEREILECYILTQLCNGFENYHYDLICQQEFFMQEGILIRQLLQDILLTEEYDIAGIACYSGYPEDVIYDIIVGINSQPSFELSRKIIALHGSIRPYYYNELIHKILKNSNFVSD